MPPNRVANIRRKYRRTDACLRRAQEHLASIYVTVLPQHPGLAGSLMAELDAIDHLRRLHLDYYRDHWSGTERGLWKPGSLDAILDAAPEVYDPRARR